MSVPSVGSIEFVSNDESDDWAPPLLAYGSEIKHEAGTLSWLPRAGQEHGEKSYAVLSLVDHGDYVEAARPDDAGVIRIRSLDPYDGVNLSGARVPQPVEVIREDVIMGGGVVAQELSAVAAPDNTVVTLLLETGLGTYVRFSGDWRLLSSDSLSLEDTYMFTVAPTAVAVFDAADMANTTLSAFQLPRLESMKDGTEVIIDPDPIIPEMLSATDSPVVAAGTPIPRIDSEDDIALAVRFAHTHPSARWYVTKRARALGVPDRVPAEWGYPAPVGT